MSDTVTVSGTKKGIGKCAIKVKVVDVCTNKPIEKAEARTSGGKAVSDSNGLIGLKGLPEGKHFVWVTKRYPEADPYITFLSHYPKVTREHRAESSALVDVKLGKSETKEIEVKLKVYRLAQKIVFKRIYIHPTAGDNAPGHWWVEIDDLESYGWYPKYRPGDSRNSSKPTKPAVPQDGAGVTATVGYAYSYIGYMASSVLHALTDNTVVQGFKGVVGELNGVTRYKPFATATRDPHHGKEYEDAFQPVVCDTRTDSQIKRSVPCNCRTDDAIKIAIRDFAESYKELWSWRFETFGNKNCHEFQIEMMKKCKLNKFKDLLKRK